jgi:hypothetical protein
MGIAMSVSPCPDVSQPPVSLPNLLELGDVCDPRDNADHDCAIRNSRGIINLNLTTVDALGNANQIAYDPENAPEAQQNKCLFHLFVPCFSINDMFCDTIEQIIRLNPCVQGTKRPVILNRNQRAVTHPASFGARVCTP